MSSLLTAAITDLRSCRAVIKIMKEQNQGLVLELEPRLFDRVVQEALEIGLIKYRLFLKLELDGALVQYCAKG